MEWELTFTGKLLVLTVWVWLVSYLVMRSYFQARWEFHRKLLKQIEEKEE